ncbi:FISUMP domain-containing protein [Flavivirga abyssicola]|uniref:FISUMP domain-containing protein n=1 Tax=Flavivirga abyssicola TaxID=3063533 RepID=UPI0026DFA092|nr:FISUMP domain-containing protein [Flavivirga sp. MEBiC07777]WVK11660.1 FISUMP domain-containing protein [Flavivirga sp. MEBiC07777]
MKYINKILLLIVVVVFIPLISCEDDDAFVEKKPNVTLVSPADKTNGIDIAPSFEWEASDPDERPLKFDFYLGLDSTKLFVQAENLKETNYSLTDYKLLKDEVYYWKVVAKNGLQEKESELWRFMSIPAPDSPVLSSPQVDSFVRDVLNFEWEPVPAGEGEVISYNVFLGKTNPPTEIIATIEDGSTSFNFDAATLEIGEDYYWKVDATDLINSSSSDIRSFKKLRTGAPDEPMLVAPVNKSGVMSGIVLDWDDVTDPEGDPVSYDVYLDKSNTPTTLVATVTTSEFTTSSLDINSGYYWYVVAKDPSGNFTESDIFGFSAIGASPGFPIIQEFEVQDVLSLDELLIWNAADGATTYDVYVDTVNPPVKKLASDITETQFQITNADIPSDLTDIKTYYVLVVAKDGSGGETNSFPVAFTPQMTGTYTDTRAQEVNEYPWVRVGTQIWMTENLRTKKLIDGTDLTFLGPVELPATATSTELYYDDHPEDLPDYPSPWVDGAHGRVYSSLVPRNALIAQDGWRVPNDDDVSTIQSYIGGRRADIMGTWQEGGTNLYGVNFVIAGFRYNDLSPNYVNGFRIGLEKDRVIMWANGTGGRDSWEIKLSEYKYFDFGNEYRRMFGIRLVRD